MSKTLKYLVIHRDISSRFEIFPRLYWRGRLLVFTWHFKQELERLNKPLEFTLEVLERGEHSLVSKRGQKHNVLLPFRGKQLLLSYAVHEGSIVLIHIKPKRARK